MEHDPILYRKDLFVNLEVMVVRFHPEKGNIGIIKGTNVNEKGEVMAQIWTYGRPVNSTLNIKVEDLIEVE